MFFNPVINFHKLLLAKEFKEAEAFYAFQDCKQSFIKDYINEFGSEELEESVNSFSLGNKMSISSVMQSYIVTKKVKKSTPTVVTIKCYKNIQINKKKHHRQPTEFYKHQPDISMSKKKWDTTATRITTKRIMSKRAS